MELMLQTLSTGQRVGQLFCIGIPESTVDAATAELLDLVRPGGICLFARNIKEASQTRALLDDLRERCPPNPFLTLDQEGGMVDRLRRIIAPMPAANLIPNSANAARFGEIVAEVVAILGFNMDFAPVVDVITPERESVSNGLFSRAFGRSTADVGEMAGAFLKSLQNNGILGCAKHFPGLGASRVDSHEELPQVDIADDELREVDLTPYTRLIESQILHSVMVAHAAYPNTRLQERTADGKLLPSSLSRRVITDLLREELGFSGLVITDDLEMGAIVNNFGVGEACVMAVEAGADMLAICADPGRIRKGFEAMLDAVMSGRIGEERLGESLGRIAAAKALLKVPPSFDAERLAELSDEVVRLKDSLETA